VDAVTGAFGYTGRHIARELLARGRQVRTLTNRPKVSPHIEVLPLTFGDFDRLVESLRGAEVLYNTYWIRFAYGRVTFEGATANSRSLFEAAKVAGVRRIVHLSVTNPDPTSSLPYFRGKGLVEGALRDSGLSHAIVRPSLVFGGEDLLLNNIAWFLRRSPVFPLPGSGTYRVQPVDVDDVARIAVDLGSRDQDVTMDAVGPEVYTYRDLVDEVRRAVGSRAALVPTPPGWVRLGAGLAGLVVGDVVLTGDEIRGLSAGLLVSSGQPTGTSSFKGWLAAHGRELGKTYASELGRHYRGR
jgi:NADH dehydrogenase